MISTYTKIPESPKPIPIGSVFLTTFQMSLCLCGRTVKLKELYEDRGPGINAPEMIGLCQCGNVFLWDNQKTS